jgi:hypothetical protein
MKKAVHRPILDGECITIFRAAVRSKYTVDPYERSPVAPLSSIDNTRDDFAELAKRDPAAIEKIIVGFIKGKERTARTCM